MKSVMILCVCVMLAASLGCSCVSTVERANRTSMACREDYVKLHPESAYNESILHGEIVRGMSSREVLASWGLPNVYVVTRTSPSEQWIYYLRDRDSLTMLIYSLTFADDTLQVWDVDQKRFVGQGIVATGEQKMDLPVAPVKDAPKR